MRELGYRMEGACPECGADMILRYSQVYERPFYGCERFPNCRASHGSHPDGEPLGIPGDKATKFWRMKAHKAFDVLWKGQRPRMDRASAYTWLQERMCLSEGEAHIARFDRAQCQRLIWELAQILGDELDKVLLVGKEQTDGKRLRGNGSGSTGSGGDRQQDRGACHGGGSGR